MGERGKYMFFWGHKAQADGSPGKGCLSQWWPAAFTVDGVRYPTAEHWMMAGKARLFRDDAMLARILAAELPSDAKKLGRKVRGFQDQVWARERRDLVVQGNLAKFRQHPDLCAFLLATGDQVLVEASPRDRIWGIGMSATNPKAADPQQWRGLNLLGYALTEVRQLLRQEQQQQGPLKMDQPSSQDSSSQTRRKDGPPS